MKIRLNNGKKDDYLYLDSNKVITITGELEPRVFGEFAGKAFWLSETVDWHIGTDDENELILVATKK